MRFYWLALGILSVWRITHMLQAEDGPWDLLVRFRRFVGAGLLGKLLDCFYCLSLWLAVPFAYLVGKSWAERCLLWLALSAGAIILERFLDQRGILPAYYVEDEEKNGLLREKEKEAERN